MTILALDASSTTIGACWRRPDGSFKTSLAVMGGDIGERLVAAHNALCDWLDEVQPAFMVYESAYVRFVSAAEPIYQVNGVLLLTAKLRGVPYGKLTPQKGKQALADSGKADKSRMLRAAAEQMGYQVAALTIREKNHQWGAYYDGRLLYTEHEADALGLLLAHEAAAEQAAREAAQAAPKKRRRAA